MANEDRTDKAKNESRKHASPKAGGKRVRFDTAQPSNSSHLDFGSAWQSSEMSLVGDQDRQEDATTILNADASRVVEPHAMERELSQRLRTELEIEFSSLVVRRVKNGVCLQGVIEMSNLQDAQQSDDILRINQLVRQVAGVERIVNQLVTRKTEEGHR
jgi:hypothetical protein